MSEITAEILHFRSYKQGIEIIADIVMKLNEFFVVPS